MNFINLCNQYFFSILCTLPQNKKRFSPTATHVYESLSLSRGCRVVSVKQTPVQLDFPKGQLAIFNFQCRLCMTRLGTIHIWTDTGSFMSIPVLKSLCNNKESHFSSNQFNHSLQKTIYHESFSSSNAHHMSVTLNFISVASCCSTYISVKKKNPAT